MTKTYVTQLPDKAGEFLKASMAVYRHHGNIARVSYNKSLDANTLFIDVSAEATDLCAITEELKKLGYLDETIQEKKVVLFELKVRDVPGALHPILKIMEEHHVNISYISTKQDDSQFQYFKMGVLIDNSMVIKKMLDELSQNCEVKILEYDPTEKLLDNTVFYLSFSNDIKNLLSLSQKETEEFIINSNKIMQFLDEKNKKPLKTFEYIRKFAAFIQNYKGERFCPIIASRKISKQVLLHMIEPPCGSNTFILESEEELLLIDGGFPCYIEEMQSILYRLIPSWQKKKKKMLLTHADIDHSGLIPLVDTVYVSQSCFENFQLENEGKRNFREQIATNEPYCKLSNIIVGYVPPPLEKMIVLGKKEDSCPLSKIAEFHFADMHFDVLEGNGGHVKGETVLISSEHKVIFTGDIFVNIQGFTKEQYEFNLLAPYLLTSVNVDSHKANVNRKQIIDMSEGYLLCPGHGEFFIRK